MSLVTVLRPDYKAVEADFINYWRIWNGEEFVHGFADKSKAIEFGRLLNAKAVAYCTILEGKVIYKEVVEL